MYKVGDIVRCEHSTEGFHIVKIIQEYPPEQILLYTNCVSYLDMIGKPLYWNIKDDSRIATDEDILGGL